MPFPVGNRVTWPPQAYQASYDALREAATWYEGSPVALGALYAATSTRTTRVLGGFWSRTTTTTTPAGRQRLHLPAAADIAKAAADMLVGEPPIWRIPSAHEGSPSSEAQATQARWDELYADNGGPNRLHEAMEVASALGGCYLVATWDRDLTDAPLLGVVHADGALPVFRWDRLVEVTFWRVVGSPAERPAEVLRHLELHEPGRITHRLYRGTQDQLGSTVPLTEDPSTAGLAKQVGDAGAQADPADPNGVLVPTPFDGLDVEYVPNARPTRRLRADPFGRSLGRPDTEGSESFMDGLDEAWTGLIRDIRLGKGRAVVPDEYLDNLGIGKGSAFDLDAEVFSALSIPPGSGDAPAITPVQFAIRTTEHLDAARELFSVVVTAAGYAPQSFGQQVEGPAESGAARRIKEHQSVQTTGAKWGYWRGPLQRIGERLLVIDREVLGHTETHPERPSIEPADTFASDPTEVAQTIGLLRAAEVASRWVGVRMAHPEWTDAQVKEEVGRLEEEHAPPVLPDLPPGGDGGGQGDGGQGGGG